MDLKSNFVVLRRFTDLANDLLYRLEILLRELLELVLLFELHCEFLHFFELIFDLCPHFAVVQGHFLAENDSFIDFKDLLVDFLVCLGYFICMPFSLVSVSSIQYRSSISDSSNGYQSNTSNSKSTDTCTA